jgi:hypothetical protein
MFKSDQLIYIEMQKTGSTHIVSLLSKLFHGEKIGKHNAATQAQITDNMYFISSIRNPWDWYLSLWTFGVQGKGDLRRQLTHKHVLHSLKQTIKNPKGNYPILFQELLKNTILWRDVYDSGDNVGSFRKWLRLIHDPSNSHFIGEGYGATKITSFCGLMTYRYICLCCQNIGKLTNLSLISNYADLVQFEKNNCYIDFFVRQESLEENLCEAVDKVRPLTHKEKEFIYGAKKTNTSKRSLMILDYYDEVSIELIRNRDRFLIEKFGYSPPK